MRRGWWFWLMLLAAPTRAQAPGPERLWYSIAAGDGTTIGHATRESGRTADGRETVDTSEISLQELDAPVTEINERIVTRSDASGRVVLITDYAQTGRSWSRIEARIGPDAAEIVRMTPGERRPLRVALPPDVRFDGGEGLLAGWDPAATPRLEFDNFNIGAMAVERVTIEPAPGSPDAEGRIALLRKRYDGRELRVVSRLTLDRQRRIVAVAQPMFGASITTRLTDQADALRPHAPYQLLLGAMVRSPFRMSNEAVHGHVRYTFTFRDGIEFPLPETGEQQVTARPGGAMLDICLGCGAGLPRDAAYLADARRPTLWLQSDAPELRMIAGPVARAHLTDARKMALLVERTRPLLGRVDFAGHFSALETIRRHAGDCTEAAALLAALGRAAGIPTRVASGLVYSRPIYHGVSNVFMPHSWVLAYVDGEWKSFDAALDAFDSSHIALTVGDGDARSIMAASQLASLLIWDNMAEVSARPGP